MIRFPKLAGLHLLFLLTVTHYSSAQVNDDKLGTWYMYFWNTKLKNSSFGFQGDYQYRNWNIIGDLEQLLLRSGITYQPKNIPVKFTLGYGYILTGSYGSSRATSQESRIYQEALINQKLGERFYLVHRFRFEQRFVQDQDVRTRYRYNIFVNIPLNKSVIERGAVYIALYNEVFLNGQRFIGDGREVEIFDRNRTYAALGFGLVDGLNMQLGIMRQTNDNYSKDQLQVSLHHTL
ncbi:hypothetical protein BH20BAC1_BH20BAC1_24630 [soil metagenome]